MSSNTTGQPGWLTPQQAANVYDMPLEDQLTEWILGLSGLGDGMVRPRWQPEPLAIPPATANWCAFGVTGIAADAGPAFVNQADATAEQWRHELVECLASFYGPAGQQVAAQFRDGLAVNQNNDTLGQWGLTLADCDSIRPAPELINNQWVRRYDVMVRLRRKVISTWGIQSLTDAPFSISGE
ncbi:hypothetical protein [Pantoea stewartii]|uniref:phage neck terminator protein n=1 Tax=Pantoea stewartii TaxID=66269 RepID=UPI003365FF10